MAGVAFALDRRGSRRREAAADAGVVEVAGVVGVGGDKLGVGGDEDVAAGGGGAEEHVLAAVDAIGDQGEAALDIGAAVDAVAAPLIDVRGGVVAFPPAGVSGSSPSMSLGTRSLWAEKKAKLPLAEAGMPRGLGFRDWPNPPP